MKSPRFYPHMNRELGKYYYSERDYHSDMKKAGLSPYDPSSVKKESPKPYIRSEWARSMHEDTRNRGGRPPGDRFLSELAKRGYTRESAEQAMRLAKEMEK